MNGKAHEISLSFANGSSGPILIDCLATFKMEILKDIIQNSLILKQKQIALHSFGVPI